MALTLLTDFSETGYRRATRRLLRAVPGAAEELWGMDWPALVTNHQWRGQGWRNAVQNRQRLFRQLEGAVTAQRFADAANAITRWGGLAAFAPADLEALEVAVRALERIDAGDKAALDDVLGRRIASTSKVYAMVDTSRWVIYDSRVARALALLIAHSDAVDADLTALPQPAARVAGRAATGFPTLQAGATRQASLAFVYASWMARGIAAELNARSIANPAGSHWTAMHVELALFTAGALPVLATTHDGSSEMTPGPAAAVAGPAAMKTMQALAAMGVVDVGLDQGRCRLSGRSPSATLSATRCAMRSRPRAAWFACSSPTANNATSSTRTTNRSRHSRPTTATSTTRSPTTTLMR